MEKWSNDWAIGRKLSKNQRIVVKNIYPKIAVKYVYLLCSRLLLIIMDTGSFTASSISNTYENWKFFLKLTQNISYLMNKNAILLITNLFSLDLYCSKKIFTHLISTFQKKIKLERSISTLLRQNSQIENDEIQVPVIWWI